MLIFGIRYQVGWFSANTGPIGTRMLLHIGLIATSNTVGYRYVRVSPLRHLGVRRREILVGLGLSPAKVPPPCNDGESLLCMHVLYSYIWFRRSWSGPFTVPPQWRAQPCKILCYWLLLRKRVLGQRLGVEPKVLPPNVTAFSITPSYPVALHVIIWRDSTVLSALRASSPVSA